MTGRYRGLPGVRGGYSGLQRVTRITMGYKGGYQGLQVTGDYSGLKRVTRITRGYKGLQRVTGGYKW